MKKYHYWVLKVHNQYIGKQSCESSHYTFVDRAYRTRYATLESAKRGQKYFSDYGFISKIVRVTCSYKEGSQRKRSCNNKTKMLPWLVTQ